MELQPIVGSACAHCQQKILVDLDGKNCKRCGLALHRRCGRAHKEACAGRAAVETVAHDYDEVAPFEFTARWTVITSVAMFVLMLGLAMVVMAPARTDDEASAPTSSRTKAGYAALVVGLVAMAGGYAFERSRQSASRRSG